MPVLGSGRSFGVVWGSAALLAELLLLCAAAASGASAADGGGGARATAAEGPLPGGLVTVFAAECNDYMDWQSIAVVYSHRKSKVPGPIYRILTCSEHALRTYRNVDIVPTHVSPSWTFNKHNNDAYLAYNKPGALIDWLEKAPPQEEWVLVIDPDMIMRDSFTDWGRVYGADRGWAVSLYFGYMKGVNNNLSATHVPEVEPRQDTLAGPRGRRGDMASGVVLMHRDDLKSVAPLWLHYSETVRDDPLGYQETGDEWAKKPGQKAWISEMYGYSFGAAKAGVWHRVDYMAQLYPGYQPYDKPLILHYGRRWDVGAWAYQKHWFRHFKALKCPPWPHMGELLTGADVASKVAGGLFPHPPHPSEFAHLEPAKLYKELLSIQVIATVNAALCEKHLANCPPSDELTEQCEKVKRLEKEVDNKIRDIEQGAAVCTDRKPVHECRNWAARQLCWGDPGFMHNWCRETCGLCRLPAGHRQVAWNESLAGAARGGGRHKQKGGRKEQLPHWAEQLHAADGHSMQALGGGHTGDGGGVTEGSGGSSSRGGGAAGDGFILVGSGGGHWLLYTSAAAWGLLLVGVAGMTVRVWLAARHKRQRGQGLTRLPVGVRQFRQPRAAAALLG